MATATVNGMKFNYADRGRGRAIVLVHGFPLDSRIWEAQVEALSDRYRVVAPDLRGFGETTSADPFTMNSQADDLHALLKQLNVLPCIFGGLSMGGYVALAFAKKYASDLRGLLLIDTRAEADTPEGKENRNKSIQKVRMSGSKAIADEMFPKMISTETAEHRQDIGHKLRRIMESQTPKTIENALVALRDREDHTGNLPSIPVPTLIIVGGHDAITPPAMSEAMNRALRNPTLVTISHAGHMSPMEQPDDVTQAIRRFVESTVKER